MVWKGADDPCRIGWLLSVEQGGNYLAALSPLDRRAVFVCQPYRCAPLRCCRVAVESEREVPPLSDRAPGAYGRTEGIWGDHACTVPWQDASHWKPPTA